MKALHLPTITGTDGRYSKSEILGMLERVAQGQDRLIHTARVMQLLGCGKTKCYELMNAGELGPVFKLGASRKLLQSQVVDYIAGGVWEEAQ